VEAPMKVKVFCYFYNEEFLAPFFLSHYRWADKVHAFVDESTDRTRAILASAPNVEIEDFRSPAGMDDLLKVRKINETISRRDSEFDWHIIVDADEFIWPHGDWACASVEAFLAAVPPSETVLMARMWNVYRHVTDGELDASKTPVVLQRRHGDLNRTTGENAQYQKPIVIRPNLGFRYVPGNHAIEPSLHYRLSALSFDGGHWANADPCFCAQRRIQHRRDRMSQVNREFGLGSQHHFITEQDVLALCKSHENDPPVFP
jgi:hypothetical protein